jgi:hypothetical protein
MTTNCVSIRRLMSAALDDVLPSEQQNMMDSHLAICLGCHQTYSQMQKLRASLRGMPAVVPPQELEYRVRQTWHPLLRTRPALQLYPYLPAASAWDTVCRLRLVGHMAGFFLTTIGMALILSFLGRFSLEYEHLGAPGVYSLMNRPSMSHGPMTTNRGSLAYPEDMDTYANTNVLAESARLNGYTLTRFANGEMGAIHEDSLSVVTQVQPDGRGSIEGVLHTPRDPMLFVRFSQLLSTSQFVLPLSMTQSSGRMVWSFSRIIVIS